MKELSIEEKAKAYDEAIERAKEWHKKGYGYGCQEVIEDLFPSLKESEDERIRKMVLKAFKLFAEKQTWVGHCLDDIDWDKCIAWLEKQGNLIVELQKTYVEIGKLVKENCYLKEKQGEQKPVEWSGVDNAIVEGICLALEYSNESGEAIEKYENWLKSLKDRVLPQPKQEWSEEDEEQACQILEFLEELKKNYIYVGGIENSIRWFKERFKSLRPQNWTKENKERYVSCLQRLSTGNPEQPETINSKWFKEHVYLQTQWRPSDEQMEVLKLSTYCPSERMSKVLSELYQDLKKLREE